MICHMICHKNLLVNAERQKSGLLKVKKPCLVLNVQGNILGFMISII